MGSGRRAVAVAFRQAGGEVLLQISRADRPGRADRDDPRPRGLSAPSPSKETSTRFPTTCSTARRSGASEAATTPLAR